mmetsp:Transcript_47994/g.71124  ORF Transcript_47994/g.71124 Transcript_47994/m.71124 type:complete len:185 (-) Transcript_47994:285-839(-)
MKSNPKNESSSDEDEWDVEDVFFSLDLKMKSCKTTKKATSTQDDDSDDDDDGGDDYWNVPKQQSFTPKITTTKDKEGTHEQQAESYKSDGQPMILIDVTSINSNIHNKFDRNSVNNPTEASAFRRKVEKIYNLYANDALLIAQRIVIPCGMSVWKDALTSMRDERPGHYFIPIFPPHTTKHVTV